MIAVRDHTDQFGDAQPVVVTFAHDASRLSAYRDHLELPFPVLADADRALYRMLGAPGMVSARTFPQFGHNYNAVSRAVMSVELAEMQLAASQTRAVARGGPAFSSMVILR